jgi:hypothetical protein
MSYYGDPDELERIAAWIERRAEQVRTRAAEMVAKADGMRWKSIAADRCRETVRGDRRDLDDVARRMDEAAAALRGHAQEVRELLAAIRRIEEAVVGWFNSAIDRFNRAVDGFRESVSDLVNSIGGYLGLGADVAPAPSTPPWQSWPHRPGNLPASGDKAWLDVGRFMRTQGVL